MATRKKIHQSTRKIMPITNFKTRIKKLRLGFAPSGTFAFTPSFFLARNILDFLLPSSIVRHLPSFLTLPFVPSRPFNLACSRARRPAIGRLLLAEGFLEANKDVTKEKNEPLFLLALNDLLGATKRRRFLPSAINARA
jgi:hypothetical protein